MIEAFKRIPNPLQKQVLKRLAFGCMFFVILIVLLFIARDTLLLIPCAGASAFFILTAFQLFRRSVLEEYVIIRGECIDVLRTIIKRRAKYLILKTDSGTLNVLLQNRIRKVGKGSRMEIFVFNSTEIYEESDTKMLYNYIAVEIK